MSKFKTFLLLSGFTLVFAATGFAAFETSVNLITNNPGFESGQDGWFTGGGTIDNTEASEGSASAKLVSTGAGNNGDWRSQGYTVTPGELYRLSFDYKTEAGATGNPQIRFRFFGAGDAFKGEYFIILPLTDGAWVSSSDAEYTCPVDAEYFDIFFSVSTFGEFAGTTWLDNTAVNLFISDDLPTNPVPADGAIDVPLEQILSWDKPVNDLNGYELYLGTDPNFVGVPATWSTSDPNETSYDPPVDFDFATTYYWRVDTDIEGRTWTFTTVPAKATGPDPFDGETGVSPLRTCNWIAVPGADTYDVYWDPNEALVAAGDASVYVGQQSGISFTPEMEFETQYFWRIDTNLTAGGSFEGDVWTYTTGAPICDPPLLGDTDDDCVVNMTDFANVASDWLLCTLVNGLCP